jgi:hypothetical protein
MPEIENNCMQDLATCKNPEVKGEVRKYLKISAISEVHQPGPARRIKVSGGGGCKVDFGGCKWVFSRKFFTKSVKCRQNLFFLLEKTENFLFWRGCTPLHTPPLAWVLA